MTRILVTSLAVAALIGCTTLQPIADTQPATIQQQVKAGDTVELERMDGTKLVLKVESVSADTLTGVADKQRYQVPLSDISSISERAISTKAKVWTTVGILAAIGAAIAGGSDGGGGSGSGY